MEEQSRSEHILELAKELLDDIELSRLSAESLLLKASRLARWVGSDEIKYWINLEMKGYNSSNETSLKYMGITGRWVNREEQKGYWGPLAQHEAALEAQNIKLRSMSTPDTSGDWAFRVMQMHQEQMASTTSYISTLSAIKSRVLAHLHNFVSEVYYEKEFDSLSESIFEKYKSEVDTLIAVHCGDVLEQIPSVMSRLAEGNTESISQALSTARRIIDSFADSVFPPTEETIKMGGNEVTLGANKHQNRINAFVHQRIESKSRKTKIRQNLSNLYDRVSTGVHNDVTAEEARSLFLNTYLLLGEVLHIGEKDT
jgi:AbiTii-like protein